MVRRIFAIVIVVCAVWSVVSAPAALPVPQTDGDGENRDIDLKADLMGPVAPGDSAIFLVGNFAAQHNGAVITCDSAVRYSSDRMEFFGNVLINQYTTYIYGDRAEYDRLRNEARVYSDIIKVVDGDATLYTYEFVFDTRTNTGRFGMGGVLVNRDNLMEAQRGYYHADTKDLICVGAVQMRNEEYDMTGDSVVYNLATDHAYYFDRTNIWNSNGDYLYADRGEYEKADTLYKVTRNGYILTPNQEVWSDSIDYRRASAHAVLRRGIQIDDTEHKTLLFGDYGEYWREPGDALLTRRPSAVNYDPQQGDSLFMRADTMYLYTMLPGRAMPGVLREPELAAADTTEVAAADTEVPETRDAAGVETSAPGAEETFAGAGGDVYSRGGGGRPRGAHAADAERLGAAPRSAKRGRYGALGGRLGRHDRKRYGGCAGSRGGGTCGQHLRAAARTHGGGAESAVARGRTQGEGGGEGRACRGPETPARLDRRAASGQTHGASAGAEGARGEPAGATAHAGRGAVAAAPGPGVAQGPRAARLVAARNARRPVGGQFVGA